MINYRRSSRQLRSLGAILEEVIPALAEGQENRLRTGLVELDRFTSGLHPGHLVVVGGQPDTGKTSFALSVADYVALSLERPVGIFSFEMNRRTIASRVLAAASLVPLRKIVSGELSQSESRKVSAVRANLERAPLYIDAGQELDFASLAGRARSARNRDQLDLLIVDYVQLIRDSRRDYENRQEEFGAVVRGLKNLARELEIPIVAVSQMTCGSQSVPTIEGLEGATPLIEHADMIFLMHRPDAASDAFDDSYGVIEVTVAKNRTGKQATFQAAFFEESLALRNIAA